MTVLALVPQCAEPQEQCFELFRMKNSQKFSGALPRAPGCSTGHLSKFSPIFQGKLHYI